LFERTITRLLMRSAQVSSVTTLSENFRLIDLRGEALKAASWSPGDKIQIKLDGGLATRTYTPLHWDEAAGATRIVAYCHGAGPGSAWARAVQVGDERAIFGPRGSLDLGQLGAAPILFGDETSFGLAAALLGAEPASGARFVFEVNSASESRSVLAALGLPHSALIERRPDDAHQNEVAAAIASLASATTTFVLSGKAQRIQHLSRALKSQGVARRRLRSKAYWSPGKVGLD
jgi:NADPH-dependent ferric siderophore reductase